MDPVSLVVLALAAGAKSGLTDTAGQAVKDAYAGLKALVLRKVAGRPTGELAVREHEADPDTWKQPVVKALTEARADQDQALITAAQQLMELLDADGARAGKYTVNITAAGERSIAAGTIHGGAHTGDAAVPPTRSDTRGRPRPN